MNKKNIGWSILEKSGKVYSSYEWCINLDGVFKKKGRC